MTLFPSIRRPILALGLCSLAFAGTAVAGDSPDPSRLPPCQMGAGDNACRLPLKNGQFDGEQLESWARDGSPSLGYEASGNTYAALHVGAVVRQAVYAHYGTSPQKTTYALRFRVRADRRSSVVRAAMSMSDDKAEYRIPLGETTTTAYAGEWQDVELMVNGVAFAAPAHVLVEISNAAGEYLQVDDVHLVHAKDVDVLRSH